jgi:hypothetical protein
MDVRRCHRLGRIEKDHYDLNHNYFENFTRIFESIEVKI